MARWLRHKIDGTIYEWDRILDKHPKLEEVSEAEAFPERFETPEIRKRIAKVKSSKKKLLTFDGDGMETEPTYNNPELDADASRGLPK
jgi:hypothetical protein